MTPALQEMLAENEFRKEFTASERVAIAEAVERELGNRQGLNVRQQLAILFTNNSLNNQLPQYR